ncbi:MAG: glycosyltransferase family 2 protein [Candidatus Omnitrophica bacterium]|nr:glycosyltransferase family 2 protein [Candidatus Omnitrophota bacterium]
MPQVSIVIRCYNEEEHIGRLLSGIAQQALKDVEVIIVDSGSTDATLSIAARYGVKIVSIKPEEFSFGRSLNFGCSAARGDLIVIVSAHVYPLQRDWLEKLIEPFSEEKVALTYGKQRGNGTTKYSERQVFSTWFPDGPSTVSQDHPFCNNANAAIRKSVWQKLPYNENLTGLEDLDWAKRVIALGLQIVYVPPATIIHVHDETWQEIRNRYRREAIALKQTYPTEQFRSWDFLRLLIANVISDCYHAAHERVFWDSFLSICLFRFMQFWGTYQGFHEQASIGKQLRQTFYYPKTLFRVSTVTANEEKQIINYSQYDKN